MEDVRLVSFKDRVNVLSCLTQFMVQPLNPYVWQELSRLEAGAQREAKEQT
jgi:hypothetical protein